MLTRDTVVVVRAIIVRGPRRVDMRGSNGLARAEQLIDDNERGRQRHLRERNGEHHTAKSRNESPHQANYMRRRELRSIAARSARTEGSARLAGMERQGAVDSDPQHMMTVPVGGR